MNAAASSSKGCPGRLPTKPWCDAAIASRSPFLAKCVRPNEQVPRKRDRARPASHQETLCLDGLIKSFASAQSGDGGQRRDHSSPCDHRCTRTLRHVGLQTQRNTERTHLPYSSVLAQSIGLWYRRSVSGRAGSFARVFSKIVECQIQEIARHRRQFSAVGHRDLCGGLLEDGGLL